MRLWSLHPKYLDVKGLVALWREGLLAQKVLQGKTKGYKNHPQLIRFKETPNPAGAIACYLSHVAREADSRGYNFDSSKIDKKIIHCQIPVTRGQVDYEFAHLRQKLKTRDPEKFKQLNTVKRIQLHAMFKRIAGDIESWEVTEKSSRK
ncbi:MAG: DNA lyase [Pseudomonadales bacterium]|nr:DNA lyase [Pseudomonadales bacterium]